LLWKQLIANKHDGPQLGNASKADNSPASAVRIVDFLPCLVVFVPSWFMNIALSYYVAIPNCPKILRIPADLRILERKMRFLRARQNSQPSTVTRLALAGLPTTKSQ
jgi:hypothetical protein